MYLSCSNWEGFKENYTVMMFSGGDRCWNGPDRSLKVKLLFSSNPDPISFLPRSFFGVIL